MLTEEWLDDVINVVCQNLHQTEHLPSTLVESIGHGGVPVSYVDINARLRLWSSGTPTPIRHQDDLLISAHGCPRLFNRTFRVPPSTTIVFYGPEGVALIDPGFGNIAAGYVQVYETRGPGSVCSDYSLSKYQGYRGALAGFIFGKIAKPFVSPTGETYQDIADYLARVSSKVDILTLHANPGKISITLSGVLQTLNDEGYSYKNIRCGFCRGITGGYRPTTNRPQPVVGPFVRVQRPLLDEWEILPPNPS
jgi:hypothetical protein